MSLQNLNANPRFARGILNSEFLERDPFVLVDVGCRGGVEPIWRQFQKNVQFIGFEPDKDAYFELPPALNTKYINAALGRRKEVLDFYVRALGDASGSKPLNDEFWARFPQNDDMKTKEIVKLETIDLDTVCKDHGINTVDYIKLDTEGTELEILQGGENLLKSSIIAVESEVAFCEVSHDRALFADVDSYLRGLGFHLIDLSLFRFARSALPPLETPVTAPSKHGQILSGQALWMRDPVDELRSQPTHAIEWTGTKLIKTAIVHDICSVFDCAVEVIQEGIAQGKIPADLAGLANHCVPPQYGRFVPLSFYHSLYKAFYP